jgi:hypothetical protein
MATGPFPLLRKAFRGPAALLLTGVLLAAGGWVQAEEAPAPPVAKNLAEAFEKGPIDLDARVLRRGADGQDHVLPLFQTPVLRYLDRVEITLSGEAFDPRVTRSDWTVIVVFLPRTVAPTTQGVAELRLRRQDGKMVAPVLQAPYDAIPMFFLVPDSGGRRKVLTDVLAHLEAFRSICLKLSDLAEQRAHADRFLAGLDTIRKDQSPAAYDAAVFNFLKAYGGQVSQDLQVFLSRNSASNLEKFQFLTQEFRRTNLLVPAGDTGDKSTTLQGQSLSGPVRPSSAYISIAFDLVQIFQNLWPGHRFQYVPALAKDFDGTRSRLWYGDWIHTTGDILGALVFSPCRWEDAEPPAFTFDVPAESSLVQPYGQLLLHPKAKANLPFALFGHDWHLVLEGPKGEPLESLPLVASPGKQAFMIVPGSAQEALRRRGFLHVKAHIAGIWGFEPVATEPVDLISGLDPAWRPTPEERDRFMVGEACSLRFPAPWAACLGRVTFHPGKGRVPPLEAVLKPQPDGSRLATFQPRPGASGPGTLELILSGDERPTLSLPLTLLPPLPVVDRVEAHQGEATVLLAGRNLGEVARCVLGGQTLAREKENSDGWTFSTAKDPLAGTSGSLLQGEIQLADGRALPLKDVRLLPPRPVLGAVQVIAERPAAGLPLASDPPLLPVSAQVMVSILPGRKGAFPFGRNPKVSLRIADDPGTVRTVPPGALRMLGRGQRLIVTFRMADLFGPTVSGRLEAQVADATAGASAWVALPPTFLDLPVIRRVYQDEGGLHLDGPALEAIEAVAADPAGTWQPFTFGFMDGREVGSVPTPGPKGALFLRLYGWPDLVLRLQAPVPPQPEAPSMKIVDK